jgi:MGT family glycosyltransferase
MQKGFFITLPSVSINNTLIPVVDRLSVKKYDITCYSAGMPAGIHNMQFRSYPSYEGGYNSNVLDADLSFYAFAEKIIDTSISVIDFLMVEVEREEPDFIIHPHLAVWGKLIAAYYQLPAVSMSSTFFMEPSVMQSWFRKLFPSKPDTQAIAQALGYYKKARGLYKKMGMEGTPDIWDTYINKEALNISFTLRALQPQLNLLDNSYQFAGFPMSASNVSKKQPLVYISLGTMLNNDAAFYRVCIGALSACNLPGVISVGSKVDINLLGDVPAHITIERYVDQVEILTRASLFITSGGMASIQEAIYTFTPLIVIPQTTEQHITALRVEELGIGLQLPKKTLSVEMLAGTILPLNRDADRYADNMKALLSKEVSRPTEEIVQSYLDQYLYRTVSN